MRKLFLAAGFAALMSIPAMAVETVTANITPSAEVDAHCTITGNALSFGVYDSIAGTAVTQTTTISVACTNGMAAPPVTLDQGLHAAAGSTGAAPLRQLNDGGDNTAAHNLTYNLYSGGYVSVWENVTGVNAPTPDGTSHTMTVYGKIDANQHSAYAGSYSDTVVVTVTF